MTLPSRKVLVVDDEARMRELVSATLGEAGYEVTALPDGSQLSEVLGKGDFVLAVLDLNLPGEDGLTLTRRLREHFDIGIIIISGRGEPTDRIIGLEIGADDYLPKPFLARELLARAKSVLRRFETRTRRSSGPQSPAFSFLGWTLDVGQMALTDPDGQPAYLTSGEFKVLEVLVTHANRLLSRDQLIELSYLHDAPAFERSIDVRIARLRKRLGDDADEPKFIRTVRNGGYVFIARVAAA